MNLAQLRTAVYARLGVDPTDGLMDPTTLNGFINDANHELALARDWPWLQAVETIVTVNGVDSYNPGSFNTDTPRAVWSTTDELRDGVTAAVLDRNTVTELDDRWQPTQSGKPKDFAIWKDQLVFRPVPDGVYQIVHRYYKQEPDLVLDSDTPLMPADQHAAIADLATYIALNRDRNNARAQAALAAYQNWLAQVQRRERRYKTPGRIRVRPGGWT